jgi:glycosyltransferase involved in cell wall biosynthesis
MSTEVLLAHPGTQYSFHLARELASRKRLSSFHTSVAINAESKAASFVYPFAKFLGQDKGWQNHLINGVPANKINCYPALEISALWRLRRGCPTVEVLRQRNDHFQRKIPDKPLHDAQVIVGFDTSSSILAERAKALGKKFILDRSIAFAGGGNGVFETLNERFPEWADTRNKKSDAEMEIEKREQQLADLIVVPSRFVAESLMDSGVPPEKIRTNAFGTDLQLFDIPLQRPPEKPLVFLFVGALSARKGLPLLLKAWQELDPPDSELWIAGTGTIPPSVTNGLKSSVKLLGSVSRTSLARLFHKAHVFVFPSFFEGLAQVQLEAAASGLPIIGTSSSGADEIVEEGVTGFIVEAGNLSELKERMNRFLEYPGLAREMSQNVREKRASLGWSSYGDRWQLILNEIL